MIIYNELLILLRVLFLIPFCACIKLVTPQAAQLEKLFLFTSQLVEMRLLERPDLGHSILIYYEMKKERKEGENKPSIRWDSNPRPLKFLLPRRVLYCCATTLPVLLGYLLMQPQGESKA